VSTPYSPPGGPYGYRLQDHPQGTTVLVLGILSLVLCSVLGPVAWVMGDNALREIDMNPQAYANRGTVQAGRICGIVATVLLVVSILGILLLLAASSGGS
jgi:hypothetical protein